MQNVSTQRLHGLDAIRGAALLMGVLFHAAFSFFPGDLYWFIQDSQESATLSALAFVLHMFRMALFFLIAGFFGHMLINRLGKLAFVRDRLKRIFAPLLIFWPITMTAIVLVSLWGVKVANGGVIPDNLPPPPPMTLETFPLTHLWFLYLLLLFYVAALLLTMVFKYLPRSKVIGQRCTDVIARVAWMPVLPIVLAIPIALSFLKLANWHPFFGIPTPDFGFVPNTTALIAYGSAFVLGWVLQSRASLLAQATKLWAGYLLVAVALSVYCLSIVGTEVNNVLLLEPSIKTVYAIAYALAIWCWVFGLLGLCLKLFSSASAPRRYIADSSYWIYLIHLPIVIALQIWVSPWGIAAELKFCFIIVVSMVLMLLSYELLVRYSLLGSLLNGRKRKRIKTDQPKDRVKKEPVKSTNAKETA